MGLFNIFRRSQLPEAGTRPPADELRMEPSLGGARQQGPRAEASGGLTFSGLDDPALLEFIRSGTADGGAPGAESLRNMAVLRCVTLISEAIGMLPVNLINGGDEKRIEARHPAHRLLKRKPNDWQTPYEFKSLVQLHTLLDGQGFARVIWSGNRPIRMIPFHRGSVKPKLTDDWQMLYDYTRPDGVVVPLTAHDVFHLRDLSLDGVNGISRIKLAREALGLAQDAERAAARTFKTGVMAGGAIEVPNALSEPAYVRMKTSLAENHSGPENAGKFMLLEEGAKAAKWANTASDAQQIENRNHQIEEVARAYGIPRPLLMMDDTSWGSGIEQLAIFFVQYGLAHWFIAWEQAAARVLLAEHELDDLQFKFNERALLRGTLNDQANFFAKALGAGGQKPWMTQNEVREVSDLPKSSDSQANDLKNPMTQKGKTNEPPATA